MKKNSVGIIGLGYVGLPLAISFGKKRNCIGFDLNKYVIVLTRKYSKQLQSSRNVLTTQHQGPQNKDVTQAKNRKKSDMQIRMCTRGSSFISF